MSDQATKQECIEGICHAVAMEVNRAERMHPRLNSHHEAYAVILEELDEYWDEVKKRAGLRLDSDMRRELIQTAAMCVRTILDVLESK